MVGVVVVVDLASGGERTGGAEVKAISAQPVKKAEAAAGICRWEGRQGRAA